MGSGISTVMGPEDEGGSHDTAFGDLPESCVAGILMGFDPVEICRLARVNRTFRRAASADFIWEEKLPENYGFLMETVLGEEELRKGFGGKIGIYSRLCQRNLFDGGKKEFWLDKQSGGVCMSISSKALSITGIDDRRYWNYIPTEESRFHTVAYLQQIWWLEVGGEIDFYYFPKGTYSLSFRVHLGRPSRRLGRRVCSPQHIHGWDLGPVRFLLSTSDCQKAQSKCYLDEPGSWILYHVGDFDVKNPNEPMKVKFSMIQIDCTHTKGGLCVDSVLIHPKGFRHKEVASS